MAHLLVGRSQPVALVRKLIQKAARNSLPVLLLGETGTGKEVVARAIHEANPRGQFVPIDCGALVGTLMESELFGHVKGSFTGATEGRKGLVELADGGTAFFDEIGDLPLDMQVKLLRLIQEREFRPVGARHWVSVDIRLIAATHRNLPELVAQGRFREDLFYRLNVFCIDLPPLRQRREDIPLLIEHFLDQGRAQGLPWFDPPPEILDSLARGDWPGNVRELKAAIDRMAAMYSEGAPLSNLSQALRQFGPVNGGVTNGGEPVEEFRPAPKSPVISIPESERQAISAALAETQGERAEAARILGIGRTTLYRKMKQYGLA